MDDLYQSKSLGSFDDVHVIPRQMVHPGIPGELVLLDSNLEDCFDGSRSPRTPQAECCRGRSAAARRATLRTTMPGQLEIRTAAPRAHMPDAFDFEEALHRSAMGAFTPL